MKNSTYNHYKGIEKLKYQNKINDNVILLTIKRQIKIKFLYLDFDLYFDNLNRINAQERQCFNSNIFLI